MIARTYFISRISMNISISEIEHLKAWVDRQEILSDNITCAPVRALSATLDRNDVEPKNGDVLPELWHWLYFLPHQRQSEIGADGHAKRGGFLPPVPLPRRMWAGGRLQWHQPIKLGDEVKRVSTIKSVTHKSGRTGDLVFVLVNHEIFTPNGLAITEEHDIVYRPLAAPGETPPPPTVATKDSLWTKHIYPDDVLLFRYSALTFNGHRIHYDRKYVTEVEGYPGLIVHGPLIATQLVDLFRQNMPNKSLSKFEFRALRPTFDIHDFQIKGTPNPDGTISLWALDHEGWLTMQATATLL